MTSQVNVCAPKPDTWPSVSSPTRAQTVKKSMSNLRRLLCRCPFSSSAIAVVCSTAPPSDALMGPLPEEHG